MITASSFPTPQLALRGTDPAEEQRVRAFAGEQAAAAEALRVRLAIAWPNAAVHERTSLLRTAHAELVRWRYGLALRAPRRLGQGAPLDAERFRTTIREGGVNYDRVGYLGRLRARAHWDEQTRTYVGGVSTPAHEIMLEYGRLAQERFAAEQDGLLDPDVLLNVVRLPGGRLIPGNRLVRGKAAQDIAEQLVARLASRGVDTTQIETAGDPIYIVGADPDHADTMHGVALTWLGAAIDLDHDERVRAWQEARYLLFQSPRTKKGSDAVTRTFLVATGAVLFGVAPVMEQDADLRCMVLGQAAATEMPADSVLLDALS